MWLTLLGFLLNLAIKFGLPYVLDWLHRKFPWLPQGTISNIMLELAAKLKEHNAAKEGHVADAVNRVKKECLGVACPDDTLKGV